MDVYIYIQDGFRESLKDLDFNVSFHVASSK